MFNPRRWFPDLLKAPQLSSDWTAHRSSSFSLLCPQTHAHTNRDTTARSGVDAEAKRKWGEEIESESWDSLEHFSLSSFLLLSPFQSQFFSPLTRDKRFSSIWYWHSFYPADVHPVFVWRAFTFSLDRIKHLNLHISPFILFLIKNLHSSFSSSPHVP